ncbi:MAG: hypothetical protein KA974_04645 [Saprospiraceae bacterium]|nr:hypothetical protein [Saprospiraceae bacterium]MBP7699653.1 hypothetical protein [Saprospiraceae bacterium]
MRAFNVTTIYQKLAIPYTQAVVVLAISLCIMAIAFLIRTFHVLEIDVLFFWETSAVFLLIFAVLNSIVSLYSDDLDKYWNKSLVSYLLLLLLSGLLAYGFSGIPIREASSYRWIYIVVTFCYLVFLSISGFTKRIVNFAEHEEWNEPKLRKRKRK